MNNRLKQFFKSEEPAAMPSFPHQVPNQGVTIMGLFNHVHHLEEDRRELQEALDAVIHTNDCLQAEVNRLTQLLNGK
jgi:hypothetical protein